MKKINILSGKYDGSLRDGYETYLYFEDEERLVVYTPPGTPYTDHRLGASFTGMDGMIEIYFKNRYFNVWHVCESGGSGAIYVNLALPAEFADGTIEWIDLDLDYRLDDDGAIARLDNDEFLRNRELMEYPEELVEKVLEACGEVERGLSRGDYPFDHREQKALYDEIKKTAAAAV